MQNTFLISKMCVMLGTTQVQPDLTYQLVCVINFDDPVHCQLSQLLGDLDALEIGEIRAHSC